MANRTSILSSSASAIRSLFDHIKSTWAAGPVPCWTEYLRETSKN
ncbi:hypothetical protein ACEWPJ_18500 [Aliiroseovarius sp. YM-037]